MCAGDLLQIVQNVQSHSVATVTYFSIGGIVRVNLGHVDIYNWSNTGFQVIALLVHPFEISNLLIYFMVLKQPNLKHEKIKDEKNRQRRGTA